MLSEDKVRTYTRHHCIRFKALAEKVIPTGINVYKITKYLSIQLDCLYILTLNSLNS